jgi:nicotinamide phosphoribosyltransferase
MQCVEEEGMLKPFTRDTFSSCIKATYCEVDGKPIPIFKNPKDGGFKKSQKGLCRVYRDEDGNITYADGYTSLDIKGQENMLETVFRNGEILNEQSLSEIRNRLNNGKF